MTTTLRLLLVLVAALALGAEAAPACSVCYGAADNSMIDGARWSVVFMGALTYLLIGGGIALAVVMRRQVEAEKGNENA